MKRLLTILNGAAVASSLLAATVSFGSSDAGGAIRNDRLGVATHFGGHWAEQIDAVLPHLSELGVGWIRDGILWRDYETKPGVYALPERTRKWIDAVHAQGINIIMLLNVDNIEGNPIYRNKFDPDAYAKAVAALTREVGSKVQVIEILNEPHGFGFADYYGGGWNGWDGKGNEAVWVRRYVELLNKAAVAVKRVNPNMKVIGLGASAPSNFRMFPHRIAPEVDGIVDHVYSARTVPEIIPFSSHPAMMKRDGIVTADAIGSFASQIRNYREVSAKHNGPREIWITEWGFPTHVEAEVGMFAGRTESAQAKYVLRRIAEGLGLNVNMQVYYDLKDDGDDIYNAEDNFGLITHDLSRRKPAYAAMQRIAGFMQPYEPLEGVEVNVFSSVARPDPFPIVWDGAPLEAPGNVAAYAFALKEGNGQDPAMVLLWSVERADGDHSTRVEDVEIFTSKELNQARVYDIFKDEWYSVPVEPRSGRLWIPGLMIPDSPIAVMLD